MVKVSHLAIALSCALSLAWAAAAHADDSLDTLLQQALEQNPALQAARQKWAAAASRTGIERSLPDPMIGADVERQDSTDLVDYHDVEYMVQQDLPGWGKRSAKTQAAALEAEAEGFRYLEAARTLRAQVITAWWNLWAREREWEAMGGSVDAMQQMEQAALARYQAGSGMLTEVLQVQVSLAGMSNELATMKREIDVARTGVNRLLNTAPATPRTVAHEPDLPALPASADVLQERARQFCCILRSFQLARDAREQDLRAANAEGRPDWQLRVEARQFDGQSGIQEYDTGVFVNFPWLWRGKYRGLVVGAKAELAMADAELQEEINMTQLEIQDLHTMAESALRSLQTYEDTVLPRSRQLVEAAQSSYRAGSSTYLEVMEALRSLREAERVYIRTKAEYASKVAALDNIAAPWGAFEIATGLVTEDMK